MPAHTEFMAMNRNEMLVVRGVSVSYGESKVLFDANLSVKPGQVVSCVGRNGAGNPQPSLLAEAEIFHLSVGLILKLKCFQGVGDFFFPPVSLAGGKEKRKQ